MEGNLASKITGGLSSAWNSVQNISASDNHDYSLFHHQIDDYQFFHELLHIGAAITWMLAYAALLQKLREERSAKGISLQSLLALTLSELSNCVLSCVLVWHDYPMPRFFLILDFLCTILSFVAFRRVIRKYRSSYEEERDTFGLVCCPCLKLQKLNNETVSQSGKQYGGGVSVSFLKFPLHWLSLYVIAGLLAIILHIVRRADSPQWFSFWECYTDAVVGLALIPQLHQFYNGRPRRVSSLLGRFVILLLLARTLSLFYWLTDVHFLGLYFPGRGVHIVGDLFNIMILADFAFYYIKFKLKPSTTGDICLPV